MADGRVYIFSHTRIPKPDVTLPSPKYPPLSPDEQKAMSSESLAEYERNRHEEERTRIVQSHDFTESLICLNSQTGETLWRAETPSVYTNIPQSGTPAVAGGRVYALGAGRWARCFDAVTGSEIWETRLSGEFAEECWNSSFLVTDGVAVVSAGRLFGLDAVNGSVLWEGDPERTAGSHSSPVAWTSASRTLVIANVGGRDTIAVDPATGEEIWRVQSEADLSTPVVHHDRLITFGNSRPKGLRCFRLTESGAEHLCTYQGAADKGSSPVAVGDHVYVQGERRLACIDLETGKEQWRISLALKTPQYTSLIAADQKIFYAQEGIMWFVADPAEFRPLATAKIGHDSLLATEEFLRSRLGLDELEQTADGTEKAQSLFQEKVESQGPVECASPAIAEGKLLVRLRNRVVCYDLTFGPPGTKQRIQAWRAGRGAVDWHRPHPADGAGRASRS